jgi:hypothetical protein
MRPSPTLRLARAARRALATAVITGALAAGCAVDGGSRGPRGGAVRRPPAPPPIAEPVPLPAEPPAPRAYDGGYARGWSDREEGRAPDYERWAGEYGGDERGFRAGYADGYQRRPHRYGGAAPR